jgi:methoxymalonate biosynthesis acyl carrier protein
MTQSEARSKVRAFLEKFIRDQDFQDGDNVFALGLVNSLMAMQLVLFLEKEFGVKFANQDLNLKNFRSVDSMVELLGARGIIAAA